MPLIAADDMSDTVSNSLGTADTGGSWTLEGAAAARYNKSGGIAIITGSGSEFNRAQLRSVSVADGTFTVKVRVTALASNTQHGLTARWGSGGGDNNYRLYPIFESSNALNVRLLKRVSGVETEIDLQTGVGPYAANEWWWVELILSGTTQEGRVWKDGTGRPSTATVTGTDSAITTAGAVGFASYFPSSATAHYDDLLVTSPGPVSATATDAPTLSDSVGRLAGLGRATTSAPTLSDSVSASIEGAVEGVQVFLFGGL